MRTAGPRALAPRAARTATVAVALGLLGAGAGCGPRRAAPEAAPGTTPQRVVSMAPHLTEIVFDLGLGDRLVGVDDYSLFPPAASRLAKVGNLFAPQLEALVSLAPDLVLVLPSHGDLTSRLDALGIAHQSFAHETLADIVETQRRLGEIFHLGEAAARRIEAFERGLAPRPILDGATVLVAIGRPAGEVREVVAAGPHTFLDEIVTRLGGRNAVSDAPTRWPRVAIEEIVARDPRWIVELDAEETPAAAPADPSAARAARQAVVDAAWHRLPGLAAVREGRLLALYGGHTLVPGPRLVTLYDELATAFAAPTGPRPTPQEGRRP